MFERGEDAEPSRYPITDEDAKKIIQLAETAMTYTDTKKAGTRWDIIFLFRKAYEIGYGAWWVKKQNKDEKDEQ